MEEKHDVLQFKCQIKLFMSKPPLHSRRGVNEMNMNEWEIRGGCRRARSVAAW